MQNSEAILLSFIKKNKFFLHVFIGTDKRLLVVSYQPLISRLADWFGHVIHHSLGLAMALLWDLCHFMPPSTEPARQDIDLGRAERTESVSVWFGFYCEECECQRLWFWGFSDNPGRARVTLSSLGLTPRSHLETGSCNIVSAKRVLDQPLGSYGPVLPTNHCGV